MVCVMGENLAGRKWRINTSGDERLVTSKFPRRRSCLRQSDLACRKRNKINLVASCVQGVRGKCQHIMSWGCILGRLTSVQTHSSSTERLHSVSFNKLSYDEPLQGSNNVKQAKIYQEKPPPNSLVNVSTPVHNFPCSLCKYTNVSREKQQAS